MGWNLAAIITDKGLRMPYMIAPTTQFEDATRSEGAPTRTTLRLADLDLNDLDQIQVAMDVDTDGIDLASITTSRSD